MIGGYMNKILFVDLTRRKIREESLDVNLMKEYLGGYGLGARIVYEKQKAKVNPFGEGNFLGVLTGPLTGTSLPFVARFTVVGKSPLTNSWGDANSGGYFGPLLKSSGYDGIFFYGISEKPVYFLVNQGKAEIRSAEELWGQDTYYTEEFMKNKYGKRAELICIGPAGEKLSKIAAIITSKGRAAGRSGLGAVMGSKKLKAVVALGGVDVSVANSEQIEKLRRKYTKQMRDGLGFASMYSTTGTPGYIMGGSINGDSPVKNWCGVGIKDLIKYENYDYENFKQYIVGRGSCYKCPMGDWKYVSIKEGPYVLKEKSHIPEYESASAFGSYCLNDNIESIIKCNDICNRYGLDTISAGSTIAFAISCYENGLISIRDTDGIELTWGNHSAIVKMTEKLAKREGIGDILADGVKLAAERIGKGSEKYAVHVGGQELPAHDSRFEPSMASIYTYDATPGRHTQASQYCVPPKLSEMMKDIDFSFSFGNKRNIYSGRAKAQKILSSLMHCVNSMGFCLFGYLSTEVDFMQECYSAVTGINVNLEDLMTIGERIGDLRLAFTIREGINIVKLNYPKIALGIPPLKEGPTKDITVDMDLMRKEFFNEMEWDLKTGKPKKHKLKELGLEWLVKDIWR